MSRKNKKGLFIKPPNVNSDVINKVEIEMHEGLVSIDDLDFWSDNPRIYSKVNKKISASSMSHSDEKEFIYEALIKTQPVRKLIKNIETDGAINDPLYVARDISGKTDRHIVYEGNSRLAVSMLFARNGEKGVKDWNYVKVKKLPDGTTQESIRKLVGAFHMQGKNPWPPFELGGFIYRAVEDERAMGSSKNEAFKKVAEEFGESTGSVKGHHKVMDFMRDMSPTTQEEQISYWKNYFSGMHANTLKTFNYKHPINVEDTEGIKNPKEDMLDTKMKESIGWYIETQLKDGGAAVGFRNDCQRISESYKKHGKREIIVAFLNGDLTMQEAALAAEEGGVGNAEYERIKDFRDWIIKPDTIRKLKNSTKKYTDLERFVDGIVLGLQQASKDLKKLRQKNK